MRPGVNVEVRDIPPPRSAPTDTGVWFAVGLAEKGSTIEPILLSSMSDYARYFGDRVTYGLLYDALDAYFREGGRRAYVSRVVGPNPVYAGKALRDVDTSSGSFSQPSPDIVTTDSGGDADAAAAVGSPLTAIAKSPGAWGNNISVEIAAGVSAGTFVVKVYYNSVLVETSADLADPAAAVTWSTKSRYISFQLNSSASDPAVQGPIALSGGADDRSNITDAQWLAALNRFAKNLGPGQVSMPGRTTSTAHSQLLAHAEARNRVAFLDYADTNSASSLETATTADRATNGARFGGAFGPWAVVPGILAGTTRTVPYSAIQAGICAKNDVSLNPGTPAAGDRGISQYALRLSQAPWLDDVREDLNDAGFNVALVRNGRVTTYGYRSLTNPDTDPNWVNLAHARLVMDIRAKGEAILEHHMFEDIDGRGFLFSTVTGELKALLSRYWEAGALFGATPNEAYLVLCDFTNNTPDTIANRELHASIAIRPSEMAEMITFEIISVPVTINLV